MATAARTRGRTARAAVSDALNAARDAGRLKPWHEPGAAVALILATSLQRKDVPTGELVRLSTELREVLADLPLADLGVSGDGDGDDPDAELAELTRSGPTLGDSPYA